MKSSVLRMLIYWDFFSLFPAWAGVILNNVHRIAVFLTFPRVGGGDPRYAPGGGEVSGFSPRGRG